MFIGSVALIVLMLALIAVIPTWPHSRSWGFGHSGFVAVVIVLLLVLLVIGRL